MKDNSFSDLFMSDVLETDTEFIPLISAEDEENMDKETIPDDLPVLPLRNNVLFPGVVIPITVGRDKSIKLIQDAYKGDRTIGVVAQKDVEEEEPDVDGIHKIGTIARIVRMLKMPDGATTIIIQGKKRFVLDEITATEPYFRATASEFRDVKPKKKSANLDALVSSIKEMALQIIQLSPNIPSEASFAIKNIESVSFMVSFIASNMNASVETKQSMLEEPRLEERCKMVLRHMTKELQMLELKNDIQSKVKQDIDKQQREYFLHQQMKTIQDELGDNPVEEEINELRKKASKKKWSKEVGKTFHKELDKLQRMNPSAAEYSVQLNYLELLVELPWNEYTKDKFDLNKADRILNRDHYGLEKVKERILEQLAVFKLKKNLKSPILCLYGPPGVGKTSLGKSIASALGRKYARMSLGGLRDEAEIRGHRKTYIGAMPGRIIQSIKKCQSANPVFILDEIDKLAQDAHGDPSSALLEVLDPEQNETFYDNYVEQDFDLSNVLFIATANNLATIQPALRDRMEIIEVSGYTLEEKVEIAKRHLLPKQLKATGVEKSQIKLGKATMEAIIGEYTNESGVRSLEKRLSKLVRYRAKQIAMEQEYKPAISPEQLKEIFGPTHVKDKYQGNDFAGVVTGLAWTPTGGDILFVETSLSRGKGKLTLTGNLGDVMKESALLALEYLKANASMLNLDPKVFDEWNVHIHVPEGAVPKDGPSAGITMLTSIASAFTQKKVRGFLAMTGEITLRGKVLPVGGVKEKILAAKRAGIREILLSIQNEKDILDIDESYLKGLKFTYVSTMEEVLQRAILKEKVDKARTITAAASN